MKKILFALCVTGLFASCSQDGNNNNAQIAKNKATTQRFYDEVFNKHNTTLIDSILAPDYVDHSPAPAYEGNLEGTKKSFADFFTGFPDVTMTVNFTVADSNTVVAHVTTTGTNTGSMMGMAPTGKKISFEGVDIMKFNKEGKVTEHWGYIEESKMMSQLGLMPDMSEQGSTSTSTTSSTTSSTAGDGASAATGKANVPTTTTTVKEVTKEKVKESKK